MMEDDLIRTSEALLCNINGMTWDNVREETASDQDFHQLSNLIETGLPEEKEQYPKSLQEYHKYRDHLYIVDGVIMYNDRVLVPPSVRSKMLSTLYAAHQGITTMTARATSAVF